MSKTINIYLNYFFKHYLTILVYKSCSSVLNTASIFIPLKDYKTSLRALSHFEVFFLLFLTVPIPTLPLIPTFVSETRRWDPWDIFTGVVRFNLASADFRERPGGSDLRPLRDADLSFSPASTCLETRHRVTIVDGLMGWGDGDQNLNSMWAERWDSRR